MQRTSAFLTTAIIFFVATPALACLWDYDTLKMEKRQFPGALELITGKFLRHGEAFYRWRIADRKARIAKTPEDLALYDDLAVAHDKVGESRKAIEVMLEKAKRNSDLYETQANLGTFYIHAGDLETGLVHIGRAIEINPEAHFGRELYQKLLVEYVLTKQQEGKLLLPLDSAWRKYGHKAGFAKFVLERREAELPTEPRDGKDPWDIEVAAASKGVLGMMRFGHHDSPVLLEALGDLLVAGEGDGAKRLACRAFLKASFECKDAARAAYRKTAEAILSMQTVDPNTTTTLTLGQVEKSLRGELEEARAFHAEVLANEKRWIESGENPEAKFDEVYYGVEQPAPTPAPTSRRISLLLLGAIFVVLVGLSWLLLRRGH